MQPGTDDKAPAAGHGQGRTPRHRRLYRIRDGQSIAGVCNGLSTYSDIRVDWVRSIFVLLALVTGGLFVLVYVAMMFILPVIATRADWYEEMNSATG